ncbi:uncharacterized protein AMSG_08428 [Thecamonas trahens ATCC 50062]|uniref:Uncharacterized protein n=1 Tax=Thecamonas trahens ATCC 50062 TaxID=461836 RepID=A0A0L0DK58_THETB|nr:hypothetical protein AMSG_08428 [Thecamonas trahens ATCC 50062]KNC52446.1 hypothetical protein AMSG_08428 [Thecamonas trahens ATCC 50062]|eukprot:XP_013755486.1 hypothetical protein AMSG_08428 [Thecamonas trahens ATCC 50062]
MEVPRARVPARDLLSLTKTVAALRGQLALTEERVAQLAPAHPLPVEKAHVKQMPLAVAVLAEGDDADGGKSARTARTPASSAAASAKSNRAANARIARLEKELKAANARIRKLFVQRDTLKAKLAAGAENAEPNKMTRPGTAVATRADSAAIRSLKAERDELLENLRGEAQVAEEQRAYIKVLKSMLEQKGLHAVQAAELAAENEALKARVLDVESTARLAPSSLPDGAAPASADEEREALIEFTEELLSQVEELRTELDAAKSGSSTSNTPGSVDVVRDANAALRAQVAELETLLRDAEGQSDAARNEASAATQRIEVLEAEAESARQQAAAMDELQAEVLDQLASCREAADAASVTAARADRLERQLADARESADRAVADADAARARIADLSATAQQAKLDAMAQVQEAQLAAQSAAAQAEMQRQALTGKVESLEAALDAAKSTVDSANASLRAALDDNAELSARVAALERRVAKADGRADTAEAAASSLREQLDELAPFKDAATKSAAELESAKALVAELSASLEETAASEAKLRAAAETNAALVAHAKSIEPQLERLVEENGRLFAAVSAAEDASDELQRAALANEALAARVDNLVTQNDYLRHELSKDVTRQRAERDELQANLDSQTARVISQASLHGELQVVNVALREENRRLYDAVDELSAKLRVLEAATGIENPEELADEAPVGGDSVASLQALRSENAALRLRIRQLAKDLTLTRNEVTEATDALADVLVGESEPAGNESDAARARLVNLVHTLRAQIRSKSIEVEALQDEVRQLQKYATVARKAGAGGLDGPPASLREWRMASGGADDGTFRGDSAPPGSLSPAEAAALKEEHGKAVSALKARIVELESVASSLRSQLNGMSLASASTTSHGSYERELMAADMGRLRDDLARVADDRFELEGMLNKARNEAATLRASVESLNREKLALERNLREATSQLKRAKAGLATQPGASSGRAGAGADAINNQYEQIKELRTKLQESYDEFRAAQASALAAGKDKMQLVVQLEAAKRTAAAATARADAAEASAAAAAKRAAAADDDAVRLRSALAEALSAKETAQGAAATAADAMRKLEAAVADADRNSTSAMSATLREHAQTVSDLHNKLDRRSQEVVQLELQVAALQADRVELVGEISLLQHELRLAREEANEGSVLARSLELELDGVEQSVVRAEALALHGESQLKVVGDRLDASIKAVRDGGVAASVAHLESSNRDMQAELGRLEGDREASPLKREALAGPPASDGPPSPSSHHPQPPAVPSDNVWIKKGAGAVVYYKNAATGEVRRDLPSGAVLAP